MPTHIRRLRAALKRRSEPPDISFKLLRISFFILIFSSISSLAIFLRNRPPTNTATVVDINEERNVIILKTPEGNTLEYKLTDVIETENTNNSSKNSLAPGMEVQISTNREGDEVRFIVPEQQASDAILITSLSSGQVVPSSFSVVGSIPYEGTLEATLTNTRTGQKIAFSSGKTTESENGRWQFTLPLQYSPLLSELRDGDTFNLKVTAKPKDTYQSSTSFTQDLKYVQASNLTRARAYYITEPDRSCGRSFATTIQLDPSRPIQSLLEELADATNAEETSATYVPKGLSPQTIALENGSLLLSLASRSIPVFKDICEVINFQTQLNRSLGSLEGVNEVKITVNDNPLYFRQIIEKIEREKPTPTP